jgi:hypothetical protein
MNRSSLSMALYLTLVFLGGSAAGAFGHRLYMLTSVKAEPRPDPQEYRRRYVAEMRSRLNLTDEQLSKLNVILDASRQRFRELSERNRPSVKAIQDEQAAQVREILIDSQKPEYEKMREERERRRQERQKNNSKP